MKNPFKSLFSKKNKNPKSPRPRSLPKEERKSILVYGIFPFTENPIDEKGEVALSSSPITYVTTREQAYAVVDKLIYMRHFNHYKLWCDLRSLPVGFLEDSWTEYAENLASSDGFDDEDKFTIIELYYSPNDCAAFLRMFCECTPLLLPFENPEELKSYINNTITSLDHENPGIPESFKKVLEIESPNISTKIYEIIDDVVDLNITREKAAKAEKRKKSPKKE